MEQLNDLKQNKIVSLFVHRCVFKLDTDSLRQKKKLKKNQSTIIVSVRQVLLFFIIIIISE